MALLTTVARPVTPNRRALPAVACLILAAAGLLFGLLRPPSGAPGEPTAPAVIAPPQESALQSSKTVVAPRTDGLVPLNKKGTVLLDKKGKRVLLKTTVCNREALLEMLICLTERKLHESVLVLDANALEVHSGLLAIGAKPGSPAKFVPNYVRSWGQRVDVFVNWVDKNGKKHRRRAQEWIRSSVNKYHIQKLDQLPPGVTVPFDELRYDSRRRELLWFGPMSDQQYESLCELSDDKPYREAIDRFRKAGQAKQMAAQFLFAGSFFFEDEQNQKFYTAEAGYVVCVANLPEALIDVNVASSDSDGSLSFEAWTERIPPLETEVTVELIPVPNTILNKPKPAPQPAKDAAPQKSPNAQDDDKRPSAESDGKRGPE